MKINIKSNIIKEALPLLVVTIIALSVIPITEVHVTNNSAKYLHDASMLHKQGFRILSPNPQASRRPISFRRPVFPLILASGFRLLGKSVHSASLVTRIFFGLTIILTYILGRIFFGIAVGLFASGLVLTSHGINILSTYINSDIILPFFILLFMLFFYVSLNRSSRCWAIFAGISLGLALLVKESALFCLGLPIGVILFAPKDKKWEYGKICLWILGCLIIPLVLWASYMFFTNESFAAMLNWAHRSATYRMRPFADWIYLFTVGFPKTIFTYYLDFLKQLSPLSFLMILGCVFVLIRGLISKKTADLVLSVLILCSLPLILQIADEGDRPGQTSTVFILLYITLAAFFVSFISFFMGQLVKLNNKFVKMKTFSSLNKKGVKATHVLLITLAGTLLLRAQLFNKTYPTWGEWRYGHSLAILTENPFRVFDRFTSEQEEAAEWLKKSASEDDKIIADGFSHEALDFFDTADYKIPVFNPQRATPLNSIERRDDDTQLLYFITYSTFDSGTQRNRAVYPIYEEDILVALRKENPNYLVISKRSFFLSAYFDQARWANLEFDNQYVRIYKIHLNRFEPVDFEDVGVNETINKHIFWLEENHPDEYRLLKDKVESLGLTIDKLIYSPLQFAPDEIY